MQLVSLIYIPVSSSNVSLSAAVVVWAMRGLVTTTLSVYQSPNYIGFQLWTLVCRTMRGIVHMIHEALPGLTSTQSRGQSRPSKTGDPIPG